MKNINEITTTDEFNELFFNSNLFYKEENNIANNLIRVMDGHIEDCEDGEYIVPGLEFFSNKSIIPAYATVSKIENIIIIMDVRILTRAGIISINNTERLKELGYFTDNIKGISFVSDILTPKYDYVNRNEGISISRSFLNEYQTGKNYSCKWSELENISVDFDLSYKFCFSVIKGFDGENTVEGKAFPIETIHDTKFEHTLKYAVIVCKNNFKLYGFVEIVSEKFPIDIYFLTNNRLISIHDNLFSSENKFKKPIISFPIAIHIFETFEWSDNSVLPKYKNTILLEDNDLDKCTRELIELD